MKKITLLHLALLLLFSALGFSQKATKVDLDSYSFNVKYQILPDELYPIEMRTFNVETTVNPSISSYYNDTNTRISNTVKIVGWKRLDLNEDPTLKAVLEIERFSDSAPVIKSRVVEEVNSDGKVVRKYNLYWIEVVFSGSAKLILDVLKNPNSIEQTVAPVVKGNRFLNKTTSTTDNNSANQKIEADDPLFFDKMRDFLKNYNGTEEDKKMAFDYGNILNKKIQELVNDPNVPNEKKEELLKSQKDAQKHWEALVKGTPCVEIIHKMDYFRKEIDYKSAEFSSPYLAEKNYNAARETIFQENLKHFIQYVSNDSENYLNAYCGFPVANQKDNLWIIDAKDEEGQIQKEAIEAVKTIFDKMVVDEKIEITIEKLEPLVAYFESLKTKYPNDDKPSRKIRYSAFFNLGKIYLNTDQGFKAIKEGEGLIANDYDKKDGERIIKDANALLELLAKKRVDSRHQPLISRK